jgi:hypothetical protein
VSYHKNGVIEQQGLARQQALQRPSLELDVLICGRHFYLQFIGQQLVSRIPPIRAMFLNKSVPG